MATTTAAAASPNLAPPLVAAPRSLAQQLFDLVPAYQRLAIVVGLIFVVAVLWLGSSSNSSTDPRAPPASETLGTAGEYGVAWRPDARDSRVLIALVHCQYVGMPAAHAWLVAKREAHQEQLTLKPELAAWRAARCAPPPSFYALDATLKTYVTPAYFWQLRAALQRESYKWLDALQPRVQVVLLDLPRGRLYYRVVALSNNNNQKLEPVLVGHAELLAVLRTYSDAVFDELASLRLVQWPCVCPAHLGLVGTGLHLVPPAKRGADWRVYSNVQNSGLPLASASSDEMSVSDFHYSHLVGGGFPAVADETLWPRQNRSFAYSDVLYPTAYVPAALQRRKTLLALDPALERELHALALVDDDDDGAENGRAALMQPPSTEPSVRMAIFSVHRGRVDDGTALRHDKQRASPQFTECYYRCKALDEYLASLLRPPTSQELADEAAAAAAAAAARATAAPPPPTPPKAARPAKPADNDIYL